MRNIKEIIAFGDSWTMGEGWVDHSEERVAIKKREWYRPFAGSCS